jgi:hypothetical protein
MVLSPARQELYNAIRASSNDDGCAENLKAIVEARCTLPLSKAYSYLRNFKDIEVSHRNHKGGGRILVMKLNKENCNAQADELV